MLNGIIISKSEGGEDGEIKSKQMTNKTVARIENIKKSIDTLSDEEIHENLKEILEKKSREERKANGRLIALIVAFLVIFLAVYHAYIRKSAALAGILVPAIIMISYGGWVALLAKRDHQRRAFFERHLEEISTKTKADFQEKLANLRDQSQTKMCVQKDIKLHHENEIDLMKIRNQALSLKDGPGIKITEQKTSKHRKHHRQRRRIERFTCNNISISRVTKDLKIKRPSMRDKQFRQNRSKLVPIPTNMNNEPKTPATSPFPIHEKRKRLFRHHSYASSRLRPLFNNQNNGVD